MFLNRMMKSCNPCECLFSRSSIFVGVFLLVLTKSELLSPYHPHCTKNVCQNLHSTPHVSPCNNQSKLCSQNPQESTNIVNSCEHGCLHFKEAFTQLYSNNGCSKLCNLTDVETFSSSRRDTLKRQPIFACIYGCERALKNFIVHVLHEIKTIEPPQILHTNGEQDMSNVPLTFAKQSVQDIAGKLQN